MLFDEMLIKLGNGDRYASAGCDVALVHWIFVRVAERNKLVGLLKVRERKSSDPACCFGRRLDSPLEVANEWRDVFLPGQSIEPADTHIDRMNCSSADDFEQPVAVLL